MYNPYYPPFNSTGNAQYVPFNNTQNAPYMPGVSTGTPNNGNGFGSLSPQQNQQLNTMTQPPASQGGFPNLQWVAGEKAAREYYVPQGMAAVLIDSETDHCYIKSSNLNEFGKPIFKKYKMIEEPDTSDSGGEVGQTNNTELIAQVLTKLDEKFDQLPAEVAKHINLSTTTAKKKGKEDE